MNAEKRQYFFIGIVFNIKPARYGTARTHTLSGSTLALEFSESRLFVRCRFFALLLSSFVIREVFFYCLLVVVEQGGEGCLRMNMGEVNRIGLGKGKAGVMKLVRWW